MKTRTLSNLIDEIDKDHAWRAKELHLLKSLLNSSQESMADLAVRSSATLAYAHWEGFIKNSSLIYLRYLLSKRLRYKDMKECFTFFGIRESIAGIQDSRRFTINENNVKLILGISESRFNIDPTNHIYTDSNLNYEVFCNIALSIGLNVDNFSTKQNFIDSTLLSRRNKIAHGEYIPFSKEDCISMINEVAEMIREYKNLIQNSATTESFRRV